MSNSKEQLKTIESFDFNSTEKFDLENFYKTITDLKVERETLKQSEAENVIKEIGINYIDIDTITKFDNDKENLRNLIRRFSADKKELQDMSNESGGERDKLYEISNYLYNKFIQNMNGFKYNMIFTWDEFDFIIKTLEQKLEYTSDEVLQLQKFKEEYLDSAHDMFKKVGRNDNMETKMLMSDIILLYHLLSKYKVCGVNKQYHQYVSIITKIGDTNKVFNALNIIKERLNSEFIHWTTSISPDETLQPTKADSEIAEPATKKLKNK